jgi:hypothetical protein
LRHSESEFYSNSVQMLVYGVACLHAPRLALPSPLLGLEGVVVQELATPQSFAVDGPQLGEVADIGPVVAYDLDLIDDGACLDGADVVNVRAVQLCARRPKHW